MTWSDLTQRRQEAIRDRVLDADALIAISIRAFGVVDIRPLERTGT